MPKTYAGTYLYHTYSEYESQIFKFIMEGTEIDKDIPGFSEITYEVKKRNINSALVKVLMSKNIILMINKTPLSKSFKVFSANDIKGPKPSEQKVFIDCSNIITTTKEGNFVCTNIDILIAYLISAMSTMIYYMDEKRLILNDTIIKSGADCFSALFTHVVDYLCKISTTPDIRLKCIYLSSLYYIGCILGKDPDTEAAKSIARKLSGLSIREGDMITSQLDSNSFINIKFFVEKLADILHISKLSLDTIIEKWMFIYGTGTVFSLEMFTNFSSMITDAYTGCYINNQKTIEKITGRSMVEFSKQILSIGADSV